MADKSKKMNMMQCSWSNLPVDMICLILSRLHYIDQIRFRAVCKNWRATDIIKYADKLPWIMAFNTSTCYLYDPSHKQRYTVFTSEEEEKLTYSWLLRSKYGWVLFQQEDLLFFYSPFTNRIIEVLPKLPNYNLKIVKAAFSNTPDSPDCVIFVLILKADTKEHCINVCKVGDKTWSSEIWFDNGWVDDVEYADGFFYCTLRHPRALGAFNVALKEWKIIPCSRQYFGTQYPQTDYLIESPCERNVILLVHYFLHGPWICRWHIYKFDESQMDWCEVSTNYRDEILLFLGFSSISISVDKGSEQSSKIHLYDYSCYYDCSCFYSGGLIELPENHALCPQVYDLLWNDFDRNKLLVIWIQPPPLRA